MLISDLSDLSEFFILGFYYELLNTVEKCQFKVKYQSKVMLPIIQEFAFFTLFFTSRIGINPISNKVVLGPTLWKYFLCR